MPHNTDKYGRQFDLNTRAAVWRKAARTPSFSPEYIRKDVCGNLISWANYGDVSSLIGWEIDHIVPKARGGSDDLTNLQPLQWRNNRVKGDNYPQWSCAA